MTNPINTCDNCGGSLVWLDEDTKVCDTCEWGPLSPPAPYMPPPQLGPVIGACIDCNGPIHAHLPLVISADTNHVPKRCPDCGYKHWYQLYYYPAPAMKRCHACKEWTLTKDRNYAVFCSDCVPY